jgi:hypothetical protein
MSEREVTVLLFTTYSLLPIALFNYFKEENNESHDTEENMLAP